MTDDPPSEWIRTQDALKALTTAPPWLLKLGRIIQDTRNGSLETDMWSTKYEVLEKTLVRRKVNKLEGNRKESQGYQYIYFLTCRRYQNILMYVLKVKRKQNMQVKLRRTHSQRTPRTVHKKNTVYVHKKGNVAITAPIHPLTSPTC